MIGFKALMVALYGSTSLLLMGLSIPLIRRKIAPNPWYGFRVRRTLEDPEVWYAANAFSGKCLFVCGFMTGVAVLAISIVPGVDPASFAIGSAAVLLIALGVALTLSFKFLDRLSP